MDLRLLLPVIGLIFFFFQFYFIFKLYITVLDLPNIKMKLLLLYSTIDKTSTLKMKSFSTVRVTQRGSQHYMEKRRGRRELEMS